MLSAARFSLSPVINERSSRGDVDEVDMRGGGGGVRDVQLDRLSLMYLSELAGDDAMQRLLADDSCGVGFLAGEF